MVYEYSTMGNYVCLYASPVNETLAGIQTIFSHRRLIQPSSIAERCRRLRLKVNFRPASLVMTWWLDNRFLLTMYLLIVNWNIFFILLLLRSISSIHVWACTTTTARLKSNGMCNNLMSTFWNQGETYLRRYVACSNRRCLLKDKMSGHFLSTSSDKLPKPSTK